MSKYIYIYYVPEQNIWKSSTKIQKTKYTYIN